MKDLYRPLRHINQRLYVRWTIRRIERRIRWLKDQKWAQDRTDEEHQRITRLEDDRHEYEEWQDTIEEAALIKRAKQIGLYLDEIIFLPTPDDSMYQIGKYRQPGQFGNIVLIPAFRRELEKAVRQREPIYKKEKHESAEFWLKVIGTISTVLVGIIGAITGLIAVANK